MARGSPLSSASPRLSRSGTALRAGALESQSPGLGKDLAAFRTFITHVKGDQPSWVRSKWMRIWAALRINQGGSSDTGPRISLHGKPDALYPIHWHVGFVHPYSHWRW